MSPGDYQSFWKDFWAVVQILQLFFITLIGWVWRRLSRMEESVASVRDRVTGVDKSLRDTKAEIHRDFATKDDLKDSLTVSISPINHALDRLESKLDKLIDRELKKNE